MLLSGQLTVRDVVRHLLTLPQDAPVAIGTEQDYLKALPLHRLPELTHVLSSDGLPVSFKNKEMEHLPEDEEYLAITRSNYGIRDLVDYHENELYEKNIHTLEVGLMEIVVF